MACTCLTCAVIAAIEKNAAAADRADPKPTGPVIDGVGVIATLADVIASLCVRASGEGIDDLMTSYAHRAIDAAVFARRTGVPQTVVFGEAKPEPVH